MPGSYLRIRNQVLAQLLIVLFSKQYGTDELAEDKLVITGWTSSLNAINVSVLRNSDWPRAEKGN